LINKIDSRMVTIHIEGFIWDIYRNR